MATSDTTDNSTTLTDVTSKSVLRRELPRYTDAVECLPGSREDPVGAAIHATRRLDDSHLIIQGPPGTGKTYTASRCAVALMQQGKRVAISSNSHRAIDNLLEGIEQAARDSKLSFKGLRQETRSDDDAFSGQFIRTSEAWGEAGESVDRANAQLEAGTAFHFAKTKFDADDYTPPFDVMFVDEAGQVSLANLLVLGMMARNIVLIGDQQQLPQPIQAVHPHGAGVSALDHLLGGAAAVPPERGILLDTSYRMHPRICSWVSERFYGGALRHAPGTERRVLCPGPGAHALPPSGLLFLPIDHGEPRSQESPEEVSKVAELVATLLRTEWGHVRQRGGIIRGV